jgi:outer membrane protein assembly factor BamB
MIGQFIAIRRLFWFAAVIFLVVFISGVLHVQAQATGTTPQIQKKWIFKTTDGAILGKPVVNGNTVYFNTFNDHLIALDAKTGSLRWTFDPGTGKKYSEDDFLGEAGSFPPPAVSRDLVFFASHDGCMYAVDAKSGLRKWRFETKAPLLSEPVVSEGKVFFGTIEGDMYAVDAATGFKKWSVNVPGEVANIASPAVGAAVVFFTSLFGPGITAFDLETGRQRWHWKDAEDSLCQGTSILSVGHRVYLSSGMCGHLAAFDSLNGRQAWNVNLPSKNDMQTAFLNDAALETVLVSGQPNNLYAFIAATGKQKWTIPLGKHQGWWMRPTISNGTVYFIGNGSLNAVEEDSGKPKWSVRLDSLKLSRGNHGSQHDRNLIYLVDGTLYLITPDNSLTAYSMR